MEYAEGGSLYSRKLISLSVVYCIIISVGVFFIRDVADDTSFDNLKKCLQDCESSFKHIVLHCCQMLVPSLAL